MTRLGYFWKAFAANFADKSSSNSCLQLMLCSRTWRLMLEKLGYFFCFSIWSHGFSSLFVYWTSTYLGSGCAYKWRVCIEIDDSAAAAAAAAGDCDFLQSFSLTDFSLSNKDLIETKIRSIELITKEYITQNFAMSSPERFRLWVSLCCYISFFNMFVYLRYYSECDQMLKQKK